MEHKYLWQGSKLVSEYYDGKELEFFYDESGNPYAFSYKASATATPVTYYYLTNLQGDITGILDASGTTVATYTYNAWGKLLSSTGSMADVNPLRYRGYYYDAELEMYYLKSRYYDPEICRFINADCYVSSDQSFIGCNMFAYCGNNPVTGYDPTGEWDFGTFLGGAGLIATGAIAIATAATILTCGAAAPLMVAVAAVTASAGALTVVNGTAEVAESVTGYNVIRDGAFGGNSAAYGAYRNGTKIVAEIGTALCAGYYAAKQGSICFVAGTLVAASTGNVPIEEIQVGDYVWAWDEETGETALKQVIETYINETDELVHVFVHGEEIIATPSHPFYSPVKGWTAAVHLRAGDILVLVNGEYVVVEKVQHELLESPVKVYNFQVEDYHTYYVSDAGVLVHNKCVVKEGSYRADVKIGGDPNHAVGHAHIYKGNKDVASISEYGKVFGGELDRGAMKFVQKYLPEIADGIRKYYYM